LANLAVEVKDRATGASVFKLTPFGEVEVIILVESPIEEDDTTYLLKSETNKKHLLKALGD